MVKNIVLGFILICCLSVITISCHKNNEEDLYPLVSDCDSNSVSYLHDVEPILQNNCYECHSNDTYVSSGSGLILEGYEKLLIKANDGYLLSAITRDGNAVFMPENADKLSDCNIGIIRNWINEGALNN